MARELQKFLQYLQIKTAHPRPDYKGCVDFFLNYSEEIDLPCKVLEFVKSKPVIMFTLEGTCPEKGSILLNSHMDVVGVTVSEWKFPPFGGHIEDGNIYGRGTQDMKSVGIQQLEAIARIKRSGKKLKRTVHVVFVPDEEIGGRDGMQEFVNSAQFKEMNIAVAIDEGLPSENNSFSVCYGERVPWWLTVTARGPAGHASRFIRDTAMMKLMTVISKFTAFRDQEQKKLSECSHACGKSLGDVVTVNLTYLEGGNSDQYNIIPVEAKAGFDIRVPATMDHAKLKEKIRSWTSIPGISFEFLYEAPNSPRNLMVPDNVWWMTLTECCKNQQLSTSWEIFPMATDSRYLRQLNIPAFGFSPINNTKNLMHDHNEYIPVDVFIKGVDIMENIIETFANT